jgi:hypothetical protein
MRWFPEVLRHEYDLRIMPLLSLLEPFRQIREIDGLVDRVWAEKYNNSTNCRIEVSRKTHTPSKPFSKMAPAF